MRTARRERLRWLALDGEKVVTVMHDFEIEEAQAWCLHRYGSTVRITAWRYASPDQRAAAKWLPITKPLSDRDSAQPRNKVVLAKGAGA